MHQDSVLLTHAPPLGWVSFPRKTWVSFNYKSIALPVSMQEQETEASRFLSALEKKHEQSRRQVADAISFGQYRKDGGSNV